MMIWRWRSLTSRCHPTVALFSTSSNGINHKHEAPTVSTAISHKNNGPAAAPAAEAALVQQTATVPVQRTAFDSLATLAKRRRTFTSSARRHSDRVIYAIPSLMTSESFAALVRSRTAVLSKQANRLLPFVSLGESSFDALKHVTVREVEEFVWYGKEKLKDEKKIATCLVPYRVAVNFILQRMPKVLAERAMAQLRAMEEEGDHLHSEEGGGGRTTKGTEEEAEDVILLCEWHETDVFARRELMTRGELRTPIFCLAGHSGHGKTALCDAIHHHHSGGGESFVQLEQAARMQHGYRTDEDGAAVDEMVLNERSHGLRAFTMPLVCVSSDDHHGGAVSSLQQRDGPSVNSCDASPLTTATATATGSSSLPYPEQVTVIDTPGHRIFAELRLHTILASDCVLLTVALDEGVKPQTMETAMVALNVDRPIVVLFTKSDTFTDPMAASRALTKACEQLKKDAGLRVTVVASESELHSRNLHHHQDDETSSCWLHRFFLPQKQVDPSFLGSVKNPSLHVSRDVIGVCISSRTRWGMGVLAAVMKSFARTAMPRAVMSMDVKGAPNAVQAVVLESSKQAFDAEASEVASSSRRRWDSQLQRGKERRKKQYDNHASVKGQLMQSQSYYSSGSGSRSVGQGNGLMLITVVVKSGTLRVGTPFVTDQCMGVVEEMYDCLGQRRLNEALPGTAVLVVDKHNRCGVPGSGVHLISMPSYEAACDVFDYRRILQWYVEVFPSKLHLLRPRGMNTQFACLGNYGQDTEMNKSLGMQLLFGPPREEARQRLSSSSSSTISGASSSLSSLSIQQQQQQQKNAAMLQQSHAMSSTTVGGLFQRWQEEAQREEEAALFSSFSSLAASPSSSSSSSSDDALQIHAKWSALQPATRPQTQQEFELLMMRCVHVGVMIKTDTYHNARILYREIHRFGTSGVAFQVLMARFGRLTIDDYKATNGAARVIVCFRTPPAESVEMDMQFEAQGVEWIETSSLIEIALFLKRVAVKEHMKKTTRGGGTGNDDDPWSRRAVVVDEELDASDDAETANGMSNTQQQGNSTKVDPFLASVLQKTVGLSSNRDKTLMRKQRLSCRTNKA